MQDATITQSTTMQAATTMQLEEPFDEDPFGFNEEPSVFSVPLPVTISSSSSSAALGNTSSSLPARPQRPTSNQLVRDLLEAATSKLDDS